MGEQVRDRHCDDLRAKTAALHDRAREAVEIRQCIVAAEFAALASKSMTSDQYLRAEANSIIASDLETSRLHVNWAWSDDGQCTNVVVCWTYIDGAGIAFSNGRVGPFVQIVRNGKSAHSCIQPALDALNGSPSNPGLAVEWVMASQIHNRPVFDWLKAHADAVIAALLQVH